MQHVQIPNNMTKNKELTQKDLLVYATIKRYMNSKTKECFPSIETIVKVSGLSKPTVRKSIDNLKNLEYFSVKLDGRKNVYKFAPHKNFEPFSYEFLDSEIEPNLKAYIIASQQIMYKDVEGYGKISYSDTELSKHINLDRNTIAKYNKQLEEKGVLSIVKTNNRDPETGLKINEKFFHLNEMGQAIIWTLQKHDDEIKELQNKTTTTDKNVELLLKELNNIKKELKEKDEEIYKVKELIKRTGDNYEELLNSIPNKNSIIL